MAQQQTRLDLYNNSWFNPGGSSLKRLIWYFINDLFLNSGLFPFSGLKVFLLRLFGAKIGKGVVIKPFVNIKYPWNLQVGDHTWIGEGVWIDNLTSVSIGSHCCLSQGAFLLCGNHDFSVAGFDLMVKSIQLEDGSWVGAKSIVSPGTEMKSHSVLTAGSLAKGVLEPFSIYQGNPAVKIKSRTIS